MDMRSNKNVGKNDLPPEPDSNYYEDRKKIRIMKMKRKI